MTVLAALMASACSDEATSADPSPRPAAASGGVEPARARDVAPAATLSTAQIDALIDAWCDASKDDRPRAATALLDAGPAAAARLLERERTDDRVNGPQFWDIFTRFGPDAIRPLLAELSSADHDMRDSALHWLEVMAADWAHGPLGEEVCRALFALLTGPDPAYEAANVLIAGRPAARCIARDLAELWRRSADESRNRAFAILARLGADAAPAAEIAWQELAAAMVTESGLEKPIRTIEALTLVAGCCVPDPARVDRFVALLESPSEDVRRLAADVIAGYGPTAAAAEARLIALLGDGHDGDAVWSALLALGPRDEAGRVALVGHAPDEWLDAMAATPDGAAELLRTLPAQAGRALSNAVWALHEKRPEDREALAALLARHPLPEGRAFAADVWPYDEDHLPPKEALALLDDADARVRAAALARFSGLGVLPDGTLMARAIEFAASKDQDVQWNGFLVLSEIAVREPKAVAAILARLQDADDGVRRNAAWAVPDDAAKEPAVRAALVSALQDPDREVRCRVLDALATADRLDPNVHRAVVERFSDMAFDNPNTYSASDRFDALMRLEGGADALAQKIRVALSSGDDWTRRSAFPVAVAFASRRPSIRDDLVRVRDTLDESGRSEIDGLIAQIDVENATDAESIARAAVADSDKVQRLRTLGDEGRRAIVTVAALTEHPQGLRESVADLDLRSDILAAAVADGADATERRKGAAVLAPLLATPDAVKVLGGLAPDDSVRDEVVAGLLVLADRSPGCVPASVVATLLRHADGKRDWSGLSLVPYVGQEVASFDPAVVGELREYVTKGTPRVRARAAAMLFHLTGRPEEALPTLRAVLSRPERFEDALAWKTIGGALAKMPLAAEDVAAVVCVVGRAATLCAPAEMDQDEPPGPAEYVEGALTDLVPALEHCGAAAAPAVPSLAMIVAKWGPVSDQSAAAIRVLVAIGPAARAAIPELRRTATVTHDPAALLDAIRRIEASGK